MARARGSLIGQACRARRWLLPACLALASLPVFAQSSPPSPPAAERIRISGSPADAALLEQLQAAFRQQHPDIHFENTLHGPESTLAGVYTGTADLAWMARELREPMERMAFEWVVLDKPYPVTVAYAGFDATRPSHQLAVYVHARSPLQQLSLRQLDSVLGSEQLRGGQAVTHWRDLGVGGAAAKEAVVVYGPRVDSIDGLFVRRWVMKDSRKWKPGYRQFDDGAATLAALAGDPAGIAIAPAGLAVAGLREVALADDGQADAYVASRDSIRRDQYPLTRTVDVVMVKTDKQPLRPALKAFLQFVLGDQGQRIIGRDGHALALSEQRRAQQRARVE